MHTNDEIKINEELVPPYDRPKLTSRGDGHLFATAEGLFIWAHEPTGSEA